MILVVGGSHQGKKAYTEKIWQIKKWCDGRTCRKEDLFSVEAVEHLESLIYRELKEGKEVEGLPDELYEKNPKLVIVSDEIGYGLVPMDAFDRRYREMTGRICTRIAAKAQQVHRVVCGIGTVIKE